MDERGRNCIRAGFGAAAWDVDFAGTVSAAGAYVRLQPGEAAVGSWGAYGHRGVKLEQPFNFDDLPPVPKKKQEISKWDCVFGIGAIIIFLVVFLAVPQVFCVIYGEDGELVPIFNAQTIQATWYLIVLFGLLGIIRETVKLMERRYNRRVMVTSIVTNIFSGILSIWWLTTENLVNAAFVTKKSILFEGEGAFIASVIADFQYFFLGIVLVALVLDTVSAVVKSINI